MCGIGKIENKERAERKILLEYALKIEACCSTILEEWINNKMTALLFFELVS